MTKTGKLLPAERDPSSSVGRLSAWGIRLAVEAISGRAVSDPQFKGMWAWGLIGQPDADGLWPRKVVERVVRIQELADRARFFPRRVIRLQAESLDFQIPSSKLRDAMVALLPSIAAPFQKIRRIESVLHGTFAQTGSHDDASNVAVCPHCGTIFHVNAITAANSTASRPRKAHNRRKLPPANEWPEILRSAALTDDEFQRWASYQYHLNSLLPMYLGDVDLATKTKFEERIVLMTVLQLASLPWLEHDSTEDKGSFRA
jgi:hypothetical protein